MSGMRICGAQLKMANAVITFKIMPVSPEVDLESIKEEAFVIAKENGSKGEMQAEISPVAFGLKELRVLAMYEVVDGKDYDAIASQMQDIEGVQSAEIASMDLPMG